MCKSDIFFTRPVVIRLFIFAFLGGWVSGALGLGGGAIFNPLLLSYGLPPSVASSTGMYMIMFTTFGSSLTYYLLGQLNIIFGLWIGVWCSLGSIVGMYVLNYVTRRFDR